MDPALLEEKARRRREKTREAIALALEGEWERATRVNRDVLRLFPEDVDALNRLGKAFLELGRYTVATEAFESAARIAPHNTIAKKNLERLAHLRETTSPPKQGKVVTPVLLIEESGKSGVVVLQDPASPEVLARIAAGDSVMLESRGHALVVGNNQGEYLGQVESKLGRRLMRLMNGGNRYDAAIIRINRQDISVIIFETYRHPDLGSECSFPTRGREEHKVYWKDALLRLNTDSDLEEEFAHDWGGAIPRGRRYPMGTSHLTPTPPESRFRQACRRTKSRRPQIQYPHSNTTSGHLGLVTHSLQMAPTGAFPWLTHPAVH